MIKYQVFVSSTYTDLKEERQAAVQAILLSQHIPAGMELFSAQNKTQLQVIRNWIEESDIYMLLLGGRYGSIDPESGLSYTEVEYRYALELGKPVFALVMHKELLDKKLRSEGSSVLELDHQDKYKAFRALVSQHVYREFSNLDQLAHYTENSITNLINDNKYDIKGWIKNNKNYYSKLNIPPNVDIYGVRITKPVNDDRLNNPVQITGTFKKNPPKGLFYCIEYNPQIRSYWPKNEIDFDEETGSWSTIAGMGVGDDRERVVLIVAVGAFTRKLINDFYHSSLTKGWLDLPMDALIIDRVTVILIKNTY